MEPIPQIEPPKKDFSLHFTLKGQGLKLIKEKLSAWLQNNKHVLNLSKENQDYLTVLHHCFLPKPIVEKRELKMDVIEYLEELVGYNQICWYGVNPAFNMRRTLMLQNLMRLNGVALFIGKIEMGVKEEYDLARGMGLNCILIP